MRAFLFIVLLISYNVRLTASETLAAATSRTITHENMLEALTNARKSVFIQANALMSSAIAKALKSAHKRGITVQVVFARGQRNEEFSANYFSRLGIPTYVDSRHKVEESGIAVIDEELVITGSFSATKALPEKDRKGMSLISDAPRVATYLNEWKSHKQHSTVFAWQPDRDNLVHVSSEIPDYFRHGSVLRDHSKARAISR